MGPFIFIVKLFFPWWMLISPHYVEVAPNHDPVPIVRTVQHASRSEERLPLYIPTPYNAFTDAPHTHAGLVEWSNTLPYPWPTIIRCESLRDDSWPESSSSPARGVFQFLRSSWRLVGGVGDPAAASWREQYTRAKMLRSLYGIGSWACARITGVIG